MSGWIEWITHALLGCLIAEWLLGKYLGNSSFLWGCLLALAPDVLEVLPTLFLSEASNLRWMDGPLQSLPVAALAAWWLSSSLAGFWKKQKVGRRTAAWFVFAAWSSNGLVDALTIDGSALFWPVPPRRVALSLFDSPDAVLVLILAVTLVRVALQRTKKEFPARRRSLWFGSGWALAWCLLVLAAKWVGTAGFDSDLRRRGIQQVRRSESPVGFNIALRRAVVDRGGELWVGYRSVFELFSTPVRWTIYPREPQVLENMGKSADSDVLAAVTDGWWIARSHANGIWLADLRHGELRIWGEKKGMVDSRFPRAWELNSASNGERLCRVYPRRFDSMEMTRRLVARTAGKRGEWEANPRLAGVTGRLPEFLMVRE